MKKFFRVIIILFAVYIIFLYINWYAGTDVIGYDPVTNVDEEAFNNSISDDYKINGVLIQPFIKNSDIKNCNIIIGAYSKDDNVKILVNSVYGKDENSNYIFSVINQKNIELKYNDSNECYTAHYVTDFIVNPKKLFTIEITLNVTVSNGDTTITDEINCICEQRMYHKFLIPMPTA